MLESYDQCWNDTGIVQTFSQLKIFWAYERNLLNRSSTAINLINRRHNSILVSHYNSFRIKKLGSLHGDRSEALSNSKDYLTKYWLILWKFLYISFFTTCLIFLLYNYISNKHFMKFIALHSWINYLFIGIWFYGII